MKTIQDYINRYNKVAQNLGYSGQSVEILVQLLAQASYISEIENATYMKEASLEKSSLINSKIQHCVDNMYSVYRGSCPRVVMKIRPTKYLVLNPYDKIIESQNFDVYYLGYYKVSSSSGSSIGGSTSEDVSDSNSSNSSSLSSATSTLSSSNVIDTSCGPNEDGKTSSDNSNVSSDPEKLYTLDELLNLEDYTGDWEYSAASFFPTLDTSDPSGVQIIIGFLAPKRSGETLEIDETINKNNVYYVDCPIDDLSDDMYIEINGQRVDRTRIFAEHILEHKIFDLTLPSFGSRLYIANYYKDTVGRDSNDVVGMTENTTIYAKYFGYSHLTDYNENEFKKLRFKGADLVSINEAFLKANGYEELSGNPGVCMVEAIDRDDINTIHYKASRDRYVSSILRSNSDIGTVLEESFPSIVKTGGTSYQFSVSNSEKKDSTIDIFYIPRNNDILLSDSDIENFISEKRAYYVISSNISINPGTRYVASFNIDLELYKQGSENDYDVTIGQEILQDNYERKFNVVFDDSTMKEIESLISKNSMVKKIKDFTVSYTDESGRSVTLDESSAGQYYFDIKYTITTSVTTSS
jgi:hypothetical protein